MEQCVTLWLEVQDPQPVNLISQWLIRINYNSIGLNVTPSYLILNLKARSMSRALWTVEQYITTVCGSP